MNKQNLTPNTKLSLNLRTLFASKCTKQGGQTNESAITVIKKRLHRVFQKSQFVIIWATFKPVAKSLPSQLEKKMLSNAANIKEVSKKGQQKEVVAFLQEDKQTITKISKISLPKDALKTFCLNVNLPIVGSGLDLLVVTTSSTTPLGKQNSKIYETDKLTLQDLSDNVTVYVEEENNLISFVENRNSLDTPFLKTSPTDFIKLQSGTSKLGSNFVPLLATFGSKLETQSKGFLKLRQGEQSRVLPGEPLNTFSENNRGFTKLLKTHQVAIFLDLALEEARKLEEKLESNQLLGAFIKSSESAIFISSAELIQTLLLHKSLKKAPDQVVKQPFVEVLIKTKSAYLKYSKWIKPLKNFIFILNYSKIKFRLNLNLASNKKLTKGNT